MLRPFRILLVTVGLAVTGGVAGAVCGVLALLPLLISQWMWASSDVRFATFRDVAPWAASAGAVLGAVCGPLLAWSLLRHVSLWRVILWATAGTVMGSFAGWAVAKNPILPGVEAILLGALIGMILAGVGLRIRMSSRSGAVGRVAAT